ncbi:hypothetical protein PFISCL1PPCAC_13727, partial [Pristionchus fissidentatus]
LEHLLVEFLSSRDLLDANYFRPRCAICYFGIDNGNEGAHVMPRVAQQICHPTEVIGVRVGKLGVVHENLVRVCGKKAGKKHR